MAFRCALFEAFRTQPWGLVMWNQAGFRFGFDVCLVCFYYIRVGGVVLVFGVR